MPVLGVCLGHQAMAEAFGGRVVVGEPVHGKTAEVRHDGTVDLPRLENPLVAGRYHSLVVDPELPDELELSAESRRTRDGDPPPRAAGRGRAVPSRVGADRHRASASCATSSTRCRMLMPNDTVTEAIERSRPAAT